MAGCLFPELWWQAVDSEHQKNLLNDQWRTNQLLKSLADPNHPFSGFGTGDLTTLNITNIRESLLVCGTDASACCRTDGFCRSFTDSGTIQQTSDSQCSGESLWMS